jgi:hypothetical protein
MILFVASIFLSAFLLFLVQPLVGKQILPWFGGGSGVWTVCLTFYQVTLFLGYAYAHFLVAKVPPARQGLLHAAVLAAALLALPVLPDASWQPAPDANPSARIFATLIANVGLPFFVLSSTGPLLQAWFARVFPGRSPYPLYAASNLGSLLALVSFPLAIEPALPLSSTGRLWAWAFAVWGATLLACAWRARAAAEAAAAAPEGAAEVVRPSTALLWIGLSAVAVVLLLGVTNELCIDVASIPFLWALPLSIYLVTLILCFGSERAYRRGWIAALAAASTLLLLAAWLSSSELGWWSEGESVAGKIALYSVALLAWCMLAHGELYRLRPAPARLTLFYLCVSGGGALGGLFVGLVAPLIFPDYYELPIGMVAVWLLFLVALLRDPASPLQRGAWRTAGLTGAALLAVATAVAALPDRPGLLLQERNFFHVLTVNEARSDVPPVFQRRELSVGTTLHGVQLVRPAPRTPTAYFGPQTGIGFMMRARGEAPPSVVSVVGLGIGTLAAYGRTGDDYRFYEIDPEVIRLARDDGRFTFLSDSAAQIEVVPGDARLSIQRENGSRKADVLVLDAFTSGSVPVHLLTLEAFELYQRALTDGGVIAFNVSSNHLDLVRLLFRMAQHVEFPALAISTEDVGVSFHSRWVILSRNTAYLHAVARLACSEPAAQPRVWFPNEATVADTPLWSDDYSNLFRILALDSTFRDLRTAGNFCAGS